MEDDEQSDDVRYKTPNYFNVRLARLIDEYWAERGYAVNVRVVERSKIRFIVSDMVNGLPRDWTGPT